MIELMSMESQSALGIVIDGKIEKADIEKVFRRVDEMLAGVERIAIYVEVKDMGGISLDALIEDLRQGLPKIKRFSRKAVVSSSKWHKLVTSMGDKLFPSVEVRHFEPENKQEAMAWVSE